MNQQEIHDFEVAHAKLPAQTIREAMADALRNVLETMFFAEVTPVEEGEFAYADGALACMVECRGAHRGSFGVVVDRAAHELLCAGFYGEDESDVTSRQMEDLICELTNMLAGAALGLFSPEHLCVLSSPEVCSAEGAGSAVAGEELSRCTVALDGGHLTLWCSLRGDA